MGEGKVMRRVAIACQGGGSHTAFTAGVLKGLLRAEEPTDYEVVGLSGTSGGAVCALLAWHHLLRNDPAGASEALDAFWLDNSATAPHEQLVNQWTIWASKLQNFVATPAVSPYYNPFSAVGLDEFRRMLERRIDFDGIEVQPEGSHPALLVGAVDVLSGAFRAFNSRRDRISAETILASAAIPTLFRSVRLDGGTYWDGLFSQNPPIKELTDEEPDEIWVIQINPSELEDEPRTVAEIADRRNELAGNLSLYQELGFIEKIDQMLEQGRLSRDSEYKHIVVRVIELSRSRLSRSLGAASKMNRDPGFIQDLISHGDGPGTGVPRSARLRKRLEERGPGRRDGLLRRRRDARVVGAVPGKRSVRGEGADTVVRDEASDEGCKGGPDEEAGRAERRSLDGQGAHGRRARRAD